MRILCSGVGSDVRLRTRWSNCCQRLSRKRSAEGRWWYSSFFLVGRSGDWEGLRQCFVVWESEDAGQKPHDAFVHVGKAYVGLYSYTINDSYPLYPKNDRKEKDKGKSVSKQDAIIMQRLLA